jgi:hypothetical protein
MTMPPLDQGQQAYVNTNGRERWNGVSQAQNQVVNWIFAVHGGGIAGLLTFAASKGSSCSVKVGVGAFVAGLILIVIYGAAMFYAEVHYYRAYRRDVEELFDGTINWNEFSNREHARPNWYWYCELLGWLSAVAGLMGVSMALVAIL